MENANPYGWKFMRPIVRPFAGIIIKILGFLHENLNIGYGWVLILVGVMMRVVLFPLNQKGMKAQMRNMAAQPLMQEIQTKYKDNPEKLQKEMMKLYKEHGFNPLAGCLPMLLPWPVLIALFFVFQNTIELRGVSFLWLPDLSAPDPLFILPAFLGISMFLLQWVSMRSMPQQNPQMKMMMYVMPVMMVFIFFQLASGLNLYYATANIATLPQQMYIANERKKAQAKAPLTLSS
jgi:YidC/Oxa1 family membrane protein insertase